MGSFLTNIENDIRGRVKKIKLEEWKFQIKWK